MIYFKIGCWLLLATFVLHTFGHFAGGLQPSNDEEMQLLDLMTNYKIQLGTDSITMMGLQKGFSLCVSLLFLWSGTIGLYLAANSAIPAASLKRISLIYIGMLLIATVISITYFFLVPTVCNILCLLSFVIASFQLKN